MARKTKLRTIRDELEATQEDMIREVRDLSLATYVRAENGGHVTHDTAKKILQAVNAIAKQKGKAEYRLDDLEL